MYLVTLYCSYTYSSTEIHIMSCCKHIYRKKKKKNSGVALEKTATKEIYHIMHGVTGIVWPVLEVRWRRGAGPGSGRPCIPRVCDRNPSGIDPPLGCVSSVFHDDEWNKAICLLIRYIFLINLYF